jgi:hypothetical protein
VVTVYAIQPGAPSAAPSATTTAPQSPEDLRMFKFEETPDGGALLTLTSRDEHGTAWRGVYRLAPSMTVAFLGAANRELPTAAAALASGGGDGDRPD